MIEAGELRRRLTVAGPAVRAALLARLGEIDARMLRVDWAAWLHEGQAPPPGLVWRVWLLMGGRGSGKTRAGAEWVSGLARSLDYARDERGSVRAGTRNSVSPVRIALVAATVDEARRVMVEGPSGLLAVARPWERSKMIWQPSRRRLVFASGAEAFLYSGANADALRGPDHDFAWCDELAKWRQAQAAWDNLMLGLRRGKWPRALVTTTPRPIATLKAILGDAETVRSGAATRGNPHLPAAVLASLERAHGGTRFGRQELGGELIEDFEGALWTREGIEGARVAPGFGGWGLGLGGGQSHPNPQTPIPTTRIVLGVDPPASVEGTCGMSVCGVGGDGIGLVLADLSVSGLSPEGWARKVAGAAEAWRANLVVAEANNGGRMVASVLKGANVNLPVRLVHAAEGKVARAAPVAALFDSGRAKFAGAFPALEDELCGLIWGGGYEGPGRSPDRADAMVWALTALMLDGWAGRPAVRGL